ncbi:MAG: hypothetical protein BYD32DRAFT_459226 [Podila humilis]|nr:MAG: hypothetical protein BYD32DRAFT_459226 [Podila humilis]
MRNGVAGIQNPNALTNDDTNWFMLANQTIFTYNLASESVTDQVPVLDAVSLKGFGGVINPTGNLFVPNGYNSTGTISSLEYSQATSILRLTSWPNTDSKPSPEATVPMPPLSLEDSEKHPEDCRPRY